MAAFSHKKKLWTQSKSVKFVLMNSRLLNPAHELAPVRFVDSLPEVLRPAVHENLGITGMREAGS